MPSTSIPVSISTSTNDPIQERLSFEDLVPSGLGLDSTLQNLPLWQEQLELGCPGQDAIKLFEDHPLLPGIILTQQQQYVGMISRRQFFERMSRPYSLELFSKRPLTSMYEFAKIEALVLPEALPISDAVQRAMARSGDLAYDSLVVVGPLGYQVLSMQQLLMAHTRLHTLSMQALQQSEAQSRQQAEDLQRVLQDLQHSQNHIVQSEKMSALGQLVAGVAHEINNPVTFIAGNLEHLTQTSQGILSILELYQRYYPHPEVAIQTASEAMDLDFLQLDLPKILASMRNGADRIQQIVLSLRNFSRHDESARKCVDIHEGLDSTLIILAHRFKPVGSSKGIQIIKEYGDLPTIDCYAGELNQVFMNLLSNSVDALEAGLRNELPIDLISTRSAANTVLAAAPATIWIRTKQLDEAHIQVEFRDNGVGIPDSVKQRLFDPFFTTKSIGKGTGLGLSISYQIIVEKHCGQLYCESIPGQGTTFTLKIPIQQLNAAHCAEG
jgi:signal transduction histidine kinase